MFDDAPEVAGDVDAVDDELDESEEVDSLVEPAEEEEVVAEAGDVEPFLLPARLSVR